MFPKVHEWKAHKRGCRRGKKGGFRVGGGRDEGELYDIFRKLVEKGGRVNSNKLRE